jgi:hypothetical protein
MAGARSENTLIREVKLNRLTSPRLLAHFRPAFPPSEKSRINKFMAGGRRGKKLISHGAVRNFINKMSTHIGAERDLTNKKVGSSLAVTQGEV